ncbi:MULTISPECIES: hypothetical protein [unclassified Moraxella]|uniref:hypothetical protein n=1 Tax=unclassified Moraxella TaxID=2685852 RepID=UPI003AF8E176
MIKKLTAPKMTFAKPLTQAISHLSLRDQLALLALVVFLVVTGAWLLHDKANASQKAYDSALNEVFWLRSQASNINPNQATAQAQPLNKADMLRQILASAGITGQVTENAGAIQLSFSHAQAPVINNVMNQAVQQGLSIQQLQMNQPSLEKIEVQATLSSGK